MKALELILSSRTRAEIFTILFGVNQKELHNREINPVVMSREEYLRRRRTDDHFVHNVINGTRLFIKGDPDEFEAMGE